MGFDPTVCGSEDRRDILTTLRTLFNWLSPVRLYNFWVFGFEIIVLLSLLDVVLLKLFVGPVAMFWLYLETVYTFSFTVYSFLSMP